MSDGRFLIDIDTHLQHLENPAVSNGNPQRLYGHVQAL